MAACGIQLRRPNIRCANAMQRISETASIPVDDSCTRQERARDLICKRRKLGIPLRCSLDALLLPDEKLARAVLDAHRDILADHVAWSSEKFESARAKRREERGAIATPDPNVIRIHGKRDDLESTGVQSLQCGDLRRRQVHRHQPSRILKKVS